MMPNTNQLVARMMNDRKLREQTESLMNFYRASMSSPATLFLDAINANLEVWRALAGLGGSAKPQPGDRRFSDPIWDQNPMFRGLRDGYLQWCAELQSWVDGMELSPRDKERAKILLATLTDSLSPTNTLGGNPAALKATLETGGKNLRDGLKNFLGDMAHNNGMPSMVDKSRFKVGENLGTTPGKVVYSEPHLELIQYKPQTEQVYQIPIFIVPPQINKFYVWDLAPERSVVEFLLQQGFQVFIVSWFNPTRDQADWGFDSYIEALDRASAVACNISKSDKLHMVGACSGGITTAALLGYWKAVDCDRAHSLSLVVTVLDTDGAADTTMGLMTSLEALEIARFASHHKGVLEGKDLARVFAWLRPNDLIWSYWVSNYLLGQNPPAFDILYWNADTTNMSAELHSDFIDMLESNAATRKGALNVLGQPIDLKAVDCDSLIVGGTTDHITPWEGCYRSIHLLGGNSEYLLSSSGHIQAMINPLSNKKAKFRTNKSDHATPEDFLAGAEEHQGTWWLYWAEWLKARSPEQIKAPRSLGNRANPPTLAAPGSYVMAEAG